MEVESRTRDPVIFDKILLDEGANGTENASVTTHNPQLQKLYLTDRTKAAIVALKEGLV